MSKIWTLTKVLLKLNYADFITDKKKRWAYVFSFAAILFVGFLLFGSITHAMYEGMIHLGQIQERLSQWDLRLRVYGYF